MNDERPYSEHPTDENYRRRLDLGDFYGQYEPDDPRRWGIYGHGAWGWRRGPLYLDGVRLLPLEAQDLTLHPDTKIDMTPGPEGRPVDLDLSLGRQVFLDLPSLGRTYYTDPAAYEEGPYSDAEMVRWNWEQTRRFQDLGDPAGEYAEDDPRRFGFYRFGTSGWKYGPLYNWETGERVDPRMVSRLSGRPLLSEEEDGYSRASLGLSASQIPFRFGGRDFRLLEILDPERWQRESLG